MAMTWESLEESLACRYIPKSFRTYLFPDFEGGVKSLWCHFSDPYLQLVTSTAYIASVPATFLAFWLNGWRGRILTIFLAGLAYTVAAGLQSGSVNLAMLYSGRAIVGVGMAFGNQASPVYLSELALPRVRGRLVGMYQLAVVIGILTAQLVNYGADNIDGNGWRLSLAVFGVPALMTLVLSPFLPDSPASLISHGKADEGRQVLERVRGTPNVDMEWEDMLEATAGEEKARGLKAKHFSSRNKFRTSQFMGTLKWAWGYRVHLTICWLLGAFRALTGNPLLLFYAPELFQTLGTSEDQSLLSAVTQGVAKLIGSSLALFFVDRVGRKKLQIIGGIGMLLMQVAAALITGIWFAGRTITDSEAWGLTVVLCLFEVFFEISIATLSWIISTEICPLEIRTVGAGFHCMGDLMLQVFFSQMTLTLMCDMEWGVFVLAAGFCVAFLLFQATIPETKGLPLEEVQELMRESWVYGRWMPPSADLKGGAEDKGAPSPEVSLTGSPLVYPASDVHLKA